MRFRVGLIVGAAILASAVLAATSVCAPAAHAQITLFYSEMQAYNGTQWVCLTGNASGLSIQPCNSAADDQEWTYGYPGNFVFQNKVTGLCLNGEEGAGGVTMRKCNDSTYPAEDWFVDEFTSDIVNGDVNENNQCLYGAGGTRDLKMVECGVDLAAYIQYNLPVLGGD